VTSSSSAASGEPTAHPVKERVVLLNGGPGAAFSARQAVLAANGTLPAFVRENLLLLVTELVTNAVRHAGVGPERSLRVELRLSPREVRVDVVDPGTGFTRGHAPRESNESGGWGLLLVDRIADRWGVGPVDSGTCVWFEMQFGG
jgi:hypothetical protein